jgi:predicted nucleic acid-binding protein
MLLVDTNVLVEVLQDDPKWAGWSIAQLRAQAQLHELVINPVIYAELSLSFSTFEALDRVVATMELAMREVPRPALLLAGKAYLQYRRRGGRQGPRAARLLHRRACRRRGLALAHAGCQPVSDVFSEPGRRRARSVGRSADSFTSVKSSPGSRGG